MFPQTTSFFEHKVVRKLGSHRIFFLAEVLLFCKHAYFPFMGASDVSQESTYPLSRHKPIIWSISRTLEGNMSDGGSQDL